MEDLNSSNTQRNYFKFSSFLERSLAFTIDGLLALGVAAVLILIFQTLTNQPYNFGKGSNFQTIAELISIIYFVIFTYKYGATLGKMLFHIKVVNTNYQKLTFMQVIKREILGKLISSVLFSLGFIWAAFDDQKQGWHDKIAKTYVIDTQPITHEQYLELQKDKKSNLPIGLIIAGLIESLLSIINTFWILPKLARLYSEVGNSSYNAYLSYGLFGIIMAISLAQIIYGVILVNQQKKQGTLTNSQKNIAKVLIVVGVISALLIVPIMVMTIILPIYKLTTSF
ncbi:RDD family protein [Candidatus Daviesbacteria bacterium]|nr:RDD family protein [Candidatus Daviesbacteria bacterium]